MDKQFCYCLTELIDVKPLPSFD